MPAPLPPDTINRILDLLPTGATATAIARETGVSTSTVSKYARQTGHVFGHTNLVRAAHLSNSAYGAEARAERLAQAHRVIGRILERLSEPQTVRVVAGARVREVELPEPDPDAVRSFANAYAAMARAEADTLRADSRADQVDAARGLIVDLVDGLRGDSPPTVGHDG